VATASTLEGEATTRNGKRTTATSEAEPRRLVHGGAPASITRRQHAFSCLTKSGMKALEGGGDSVCHDGAWCVTNLEMERWWRRCSAKNARRPWCRRGGEQGGEMARVREWNE
jgi:hypothetical protein